MRPQSFNLQRAPRSIFRERRELHALAKPVRDIAMNLDRNFAAPSLRLQDARQGDELAGYSRISSVTRL
jgi:hypothetical protein